MAEKVYYPRIAQAEQAITDAGYVRDSQKHVWVNRDTGKTAKVVREEPGKFYIQWS
jgi:hypothetical protein